MGPKKPTAVKAQAKKVEIKKEVLKEKEIVSDSSSDEDVSRVSPREEYDPRPDSAGRAEIKKKGNKKMTVEQEWEMIDSHKASERNVRIVQRIKNMLLIGFFEKKPVVFAEKGGKKKKKESEKEGKGLRDFKSLLYTAGILIFLVALKIGEEGYDPYNLRDENETNPYTVLGLSSAATVNDIKNAYKELAKQWHPDKNPDCESCEKKFTEIGEAYELLSSSSRREAFDNRRRESNRFEGANSVALNGREDYTKKVLRSNDVWILYLYHSQTAGGSAHPMWEEFAQKARKVFKCAHLDAANEGLSVLPLLKVRRGLYPLFLRIARGVATEVSPISDSENSKRYMQWAIDSFPDVVEELASEEAYDAFKSKKTDKLGRIALMPLEKGDKRSNLPFLSLAFSYSRYFDFALLPREAAPRELIPKKSAAAVLNIVDVEGEHRTVTDSLKDGDLEIAIRNRLEKNIPIADQLSYYDLCGQKARRTYCLALVNPSDQTIREVKEQLELSRAAHEKEQQDVEEKLEAPHIQPVIILTSPSYLSQDYPVSHSFSSWRSECVNSSPMFLLEEVSGRSARFKAVSADIAEWFPMLALEDLVLRECSPLRPHLADPLITLREELSQFFLGGIMRMICSFLAAVMLCAVLPEMDKQMVGLLFTVLIGSLLFRSNAVWKSFSLGGV